MGFDVLYFPPIHPIGKVNRKGPNNTLKAGAGDAGSPWAIGSEEGGHKSIHPELGTDADFRALVKAADERGIAIALDIAFQIGDDLLDLIGEPSLLGKPVGNSLAQGRPMLPLIYLWQKSSDVERANLSRLEAGSCLRALLARHDIVEQVRQRQQQYLGAAVAALEGLPGPGGVAALRTLAARAAVRVDLGDVEGRGSQRS
jgi:hypothetical protein